MAIHLEGVDLTGLDWAEATSAAVETAAAADGSTVVWERPGVRGVVLRGGEDWGWLTAADARRLEAMAGAVGAVYLLTRDSATYAVRFRHETGAPYASAPVEPEGAGETSPHRHVVIQLAFV